MAGERRINWGADATDATYRTGDDDANNRFIVVEDLDAGLVISEYDEATGDLVRRAPIDMVGNDIKDGSTTVYDASTTTVGDGTTNADHASVSTGDVLNSAIGDSVDYADPRWIALTDAEVYHETFQSIDGLATTTSGSGGASLSDNSALVLDSGSTSGSVAQARKLHTGRDYTETNYDSDGVFRLEVQLGTDDNDRLDYYTRGGVSGGSKGYGFKIVDDSGTARIQGVVHDGTTETTTNLVASPGTGSIELRAAFTGGTQVEFFVDGTGEGTISSNLPSGTESSEWYRLRVENTTAATRTTDIGQIGVVHLP